MRAVAAGGPAAARPRSGRGGGERWAARRWPGERVGPRQGKGAKQSRAEQRGEASREGTSWLMQEASGEGGKDRENGDLLKMDFVFLRIYLRSWQTIRFGKKILRMIWKENIKNY